LIIIHKENKKQVQSRTPPETIFDDKKYLVVSPEIHKKVSEFAKKKKIKLIEATHYLLGLGMLAHFSTDPRDDSRYASLTEINRLIIENWRKNHPDQSLEETLGPQFQERMEADIFRDIVFPDKQRRMPKGKNSLSPWQYPAVDTHGQARGTL
jgi:hypothetical protein